MVAVCHELSKQEEVKKNMSFDNFLIKFKYL